MACVIWIILPPHETAHLLQCGFMTLYMNVSWKPALHVGLNEQAVSQTKTDLS